MFNASGEVFQSLKSDLSSSLLSLQRTNHRVNLYSSSLILCLQLLCLLLPWYSRSVLAQNNYNYVFLFGVCRKDWGNYCKLYQTLIEECGSGQGEDCVEYRENWRAGKIAAGLIGGSLLVMLAVVIHGLISQRKRSYSLLRLPFEFLSLLSTSAAIIVWLQLSHYKRASITEAQPGMTLALVSAILSAALVMHSVELRVEAREFEGIRDDTQRRAEIRPSLN